MMFLRGNKRAEKVKRDKDFVNDDQEETLAVNTEYMANIIVTCLLMTVLLMLMTRLQRQ